MRSGRYAQLAGALLAPALILGGVTPRVPSVTSGSVVKAGDVVFVQNLPGDNPYHLELRAPDGTLTDLSKGGPGNDFMPVVSPNGSKIAFTGERPFADGRAYWR